jgi:hypothetical protein
MIRRHRDGPVLFALTQLAYSRRVVTLRSLRQLLCFAPLRVRTLRLATDFASQPSRLPTAARESNPAPKGFAMVAPMVQSACVKAAYAGQSAAR